MVQRRNTFKKRSLRAPWWDYSSPASYFITICTRDREHFFGTIPPSIQEKPKPIYPTGRIIDFDPNTYENDHQKEVILNEIGLITLQQWLEIPTRFPFLKLGHYVLMPDHFHGILTIPQEAYNPMIPNGDLKLSPCSGNPRGGITGEHNPMFQKSISKGIRWFKGRVTYETKQIDPDFGWQNRFYDRIIRDNMEYAKISAYIKHRPKSWSYKHLF